MDASEKIGGENAAARPKELLLFALGGCTAFDVVQVLAKRRRTFRTFEIELRADEASEHPMVFTRLRMTYRFEADDLPAEEIERAVRLSQEKYCSVNAMLRKAFPISWAVVLNGEEVLAGTSDAAAAA
ncbi:MAG: OsmC family protein [Candidatus Eiseniibacteriota bacterium]